MALTPLSKTEVTVESITRLTNSRNGNPRWRLQVATVDENQVVHSVSYATAPDVMAAYKVCQPMVGKRVTLTLDEKSQIQFIDWEIL